MQPPVGVQQASAHASVGRMPISAMTRKAARASQVEDEDGFPIMRRITTIPTFPAERALFSLAQRMFGHDATGRQVSDRGSSSIAGIERHSDGLSLSWMRGALSSGALAGCDER